MIGFTTLGTTPSNPVDSRPFVGSVLAAGLYSFIKYVEYDTERGMMRWCDLKDNNADMENGRSVVSHKLAGSESERGAQQGSFAKEVVLESVTRI
jgi:hypothetical protein